MEIKFLERTPTVDEYKKTNLNIRTYLGASKNKEGFYEKFGFISRPNDELRAEIILKV